MHFASRARILRLTDARSSRVLVTKRESAMCNLTKGKSKPVYVLAGRAGDKVRFLEQFVKQF